MGEVRIPVQAIKGRGAATRLAHRFEKDERHDFDDGWSSLQQYTDERTVAKTEVIWEDARSIITSNDSPDIYFERSINPYRGCEHGCIFIEGRLFTAFGRRELRRRVIHGGGRRLRRTDRRGG